MTSGWSFLSNHGKVLVTLAGQPFLRLREIAEVVGVTPRSAQSIVNDLVGAGYMDRRREGRRSVYEVRGDRPFEVPASADRDVTALVSALVSGPRVAPPRSGRRHALVLACSDHRYQESLRGLLASEGLLAAAEVVLWPGGAASLTGPEGGLIIEIMSLAVDSQPPDRIVLVSHADCHARGAFESSGRDLLEHVRNVNPRRRRTIRLVEETFGVRPEIWYLTKRGADRVGAPSFKGYAIPVGVGLSGLAIDAESEPSGILTER